MSQGQLVGVLNEEAREGDTIVTAAGTPPGDLHQLWDATKGRKCHIEFGFSCMGYELPGSLGVRMAQPGGEVFSFVGDGTYLLNPTDLVAALQENLKITVVLSENHGYQSIRRLQMGRVGHAFGNEFRGREPKTNRLDGDFIRVDFAKNAESMGARVWNVRTPEELQKALREARAEKRACVIVAEVEKHRYQPGSEVWWDVAAAEATQDSVTKELRAQYVKDRDRLQRYYY
jgi:3D-(3,5/4)-trihydroxycyclohexane-1,2-dione acylhydrolase (decyclizing)